MPCRLLTLALALGAMVAAPDTGLGDERPTPQALIGAAHDISPDEAAKLTRREARKMLSATTIGRDGRRQRREVDDATADALLRALRREGPVAITEQLIGDDTRREIVSAEPRPYRSLAHILVGCSGAMVGPRHVLTAAHCIYNWREGIFYPDIDPSFLDVQPGRDDDHWPFGTISWARYTIPTGYADDALIELDYGIIELEEDVGEETGLLRYRTRSLPAGTPVRVAGYPVSKNYGSLWQSRCRLYGSTSALIYHTCDTTGGTSGAPLLDRDGRIVGVHTYAYLGEELNFATRINDSVAAAITSWIRD